MFNGLKTWQKAILITVFSVIGAFMTAWFAVWLDNKINPISKYWDESSSPVDIHALNDRNLPRIPPASRHGVKRQNKQNVKTL